MVLVRRTEIWGNKDKDTEDLHLWEDDWDDEQLNDDFTKQLRVSGCSFEA